MDAFLEKEMAWLYEEEDPWKYRKASRHGVTVGVCKDHWSGGTVASYGIGEGLLCTMLWRDLDPEFDILYGIELNKIAMNRAIHWFDCGYLPNVCSLFDLREGVPEHPPVDLLLWSDVLPYLYGMYGENRFNSQKILWEAWDKRVRPGGHMVITNWLDMVEIDLGAIPEDATLVCEMDWKGKAVDKEDKEYDTGASYRVFRKRGDSGASGGEPQTRDVSKEVG